MVRRTGGRPHSHDADRPLIPFEEARARILDRIRPLPPIRVPLRDAWGLVSAVETRAVLDLPPFDSSAVDGYAVRASDVLEARPDRPVRLGLAGEVAMGRGAEEAAVGSGEAVTVPTGGALPPGADAVVPVEWGRVEPGRVLVLHPVSGGEHVRPAGQDARAGDPLLPAGRRLLAPDLGLLASAGLRTVEAYPAPRVGILSTGDELVEPGGELGPGQIFDGNATTLEGAVREAGAIPVAGGRISDDPEDLVAALDRVAEGVDVFVSSGGVAVGDRDPVRLAFAEGGDVGLYEVAMQPGKPQAFGSWRDRPFFGLPGNPVSVFVSFEVFVRPALMTMMGRPPLRPTVEAVLAADVEGLPRKTRFARVALRRRGDELAATPATSHQSNLMATLAEADGLAVIPAGAALGAGELCQVMVFREQA